MRDTHVVCTSWETDRVRVRTAGNIYFLFFFCLETKRQKKSEDDDDDEEEEGVDLNK